MHLFYWSKKQSLDYIYKGNQTEAKQSRVWNSKTNITSNEQEVKKILKEMMIFLYPNGSLHHFLRGAHYTGPPPPSKTVRIDPPGTELFAAHTAKAEAVNGLSKAMGDPHSPVARTWVWIPLGRQSGDLLVCSTPEGLHPDKLKTSSSFPASFPPFPLFPCISHHLIWICNLSEIGVLGEIGNKKVSLSSEFDFQKVSK